MRAALFVVLLTAGCFKPTLPLTLSPTASNNLGFLYEHLDTEFAFCAYGSVQDGVVRIEKITLPFMYRSTKAAVEFKPCDPKGYVGFGHSHPPPSTCQLSEMDRAGFMASADKYTFLICEEGIKTFEKRGE